MTMFFELQTLLHMQDGEEGRWESPEATNWQIQEQFVDFYPNVSRNDETNLLFFAVPEVAVSYIDAWVCHQLCGNDSNGDIVSSHHTIALQHMYPPTKKYSFQMETQA